MNEKSKRKVLKTLSRVKQKERGMEKKLTQKLGGEVHQDSKTPQGPYVHPWTLEDPGHPETAEELKKQDCCGCASCANACPKDAITMAPDKEGFLYPQIDKDLCVHCGLCVKKCPVLTRQPRNNKVDTCFAQWSDKETRLVSSSGGFFSDVARYAFNRNGVVFGAAYDKDFTVRHIAVDNEADLDKLRGSKYVQSQTGNCYRQVKELLEEGRFVLYSGCPCQIAGLYAYLGGSDFDHLLTVDLLCHGTPSPGLFDRYLEEDYGKENIKDVKFRDKSAYGWSTHMNVYLKDGTVMRTECTKDPFYQMFLPCLAMRPFCSHCKFTDIPRVADFSIGDWWGIEKYDKGLNDGKGTSLVMINNLKAGEVFSRIMPYFENLKEFSIDQARPRNYTIDKPFKAHPARERFFHLLDLMPYDKAVRYALDYHFDIGVYGLWYGENYGSVLTYFGLVKVLESMGLSPCLIANPLGSDASDLREPTAFAKRQGFFITKRRPISKMGECNAFCDAFMVGSDQLWNPGLSMNYGHTYFLSFADETKKRIAYGTSFGKSNPQIPEQYMERSRVEFSKFDALSVRDDFSKRLLRDDYYCDSVKVLDPALLCSREEYRALAETAEVPEAFEGSLPDISKGGYTLAYILDPDEYTAKRFAQIASLTGKPIIAALDMNPRAIEQNEALFKGSFHQNVYVLESPKVEQWLYCFAHADNVLTDSFHGTLFSHVFEKNFAAVPNEKRGKDRFSDVLEILGLTDRILPSLKTDPEEIVSLLNTPVDYEMSNARLEKERERSYKWLKDAIFAPKEIKVNRVYAYKETPVSGK